MDILYIIYECPLRSFFQADMQICKYPFIVIQLTTPTVIINIIFGESQGQLWLEKVVTSFMDAPYGDLFKQKCEGVKI